jgi:triosephosphate isomerase
MSRKTLIIGNWKMNLNVSQSSLLVGRLHKHIKNYRSVEVVLAPSAQALQPLSLQIDRRQFRLCAQNAYQKDFGAYTGEVSFSMLRDLVHYAIVGHSERRLYFNESLADVKEKVAASVRNDITPVLCVGETSAERRAGETRQVIHDQVTTALCNLTAKEVADMVIAYEPVWAISTFEGKLAKPHEVEQEMNFIRHNVEELYGKKTAGQVRIINGGSVDNHTVRGYLEIDGCDGALVGGASVNYRKFSDIVEKAYQNSMEKKDES